jgi:hypothetical protein
VTSVDPIASPTTGAVPARRLSRTLSTCASVSVRCDGDGRSALGCGRAFCTDFALVEPADLADFLKAGFSVGIFETSRSPLEASPADMDCCLSMLPPPSKRLSSLPPLLRRTEPNYVSSLYLRLPECRRVTTYGATTICVIVRAVSPAVPLIHSLCCVRTRAGHDVIGGTFKGAVGSSHSRPQARKLCWSWPHCRSATQQVDLLGLAENKNVRTAFAAGAEFDAANVDHYLGRVLTCCRRKPPTSARLPSRRDFTDMGPRGQSVWRFPSASESSVVLCSQSHSPGRDRRFSGSAATNS